MCLLFGHMDKGRRKSPKRDQTAVQRTKTPATFDENEYEGNIEWGLLLVNDCFGVPALVVYACIQYALIFYIRMANIFL